jgi:hypothetical protein
MLSLLIRESYNHGKIKEQNWSFRKTIISFILFTGYIIIFGIGPYHISEVINIRIVPTVIISLFYFIGLFYNIYLITHPKNITYNGVSSFIVVFLVLVPLYLWANWFWPIKEFIRLITVTN